MIKIGMIIGDRYEILDRIGTGGMSDVYKARCHKLNRLVAVKVLKQEFSENIEFVTKFREEAQSAAGLMHPNIVNVYDVGQENGIYYIVMELVEGITLKKYIEKKARLSVKEAISIAIQISMGIEAAHNNRIVHRDIKPQNIIISKEGKVKVTDFGIAKAATNNTITSSAMGSVHYTSPEQARGGYSDEKSDIYSLGITLFEMLTGRVPFNGDTTVAIALKQIQDEMPSPRKFVQEIPLSVEKIIYKCTMKSPDRRYQTMGLLIDDLKKSLVSPEEDFVKLDAPSSSDPTRATTSQELRQIKRQLPPSLSEEVSEPLKKESKMVREDKADRTGVVKERREMEARGNKRKASHFDLEKEYEDDEESPSEKVMTILTVVGAFVIAVILFYIAGTSLGVFEGNLFGIGNVGASTERATMPTVVGLFAEEAKLAVENVQLECRYAYGNSSTYDTGKVISASLEDGTVVKKGDQILLGTVIVLLVSTGQEGVAVPDVEGLPLAEAAANLGSEGFKVEKEYDYSEIHAKDQVISQDPAPGAVMDRESTVVLVISLGTTSSRTTVESVLGKSKADAVALLTAAGFEVVATEQEFSDIYPAGTVSYQSYAGGSYIDEGATVTLRISKGGQEGYYGCYATVQAPLDYAGGSFIIKLYDSEGNRVFDTTATAFPVNLSVGGFISKGANGTLRIQYTANVETQTQDGAGNTITQIVQQEVDVTQAILFTKE